MDEKAKDFYWKPVSKTTSRESWPRDAAKFSRFGDHAKLKIVLAFCGMSGVEGVSAATVLSTIDEFLMSPAT